jgi:glycosyltransferase involved in cell wall biosynthesis
MTSVAIVHDYLNQRGGAERVVLEMSRVWPEAPIYTSLFRPRSTWPGFESREVRTTFLDKLPVDKHFRNLFPLYPAAFRSFGKIDADVVISSSSGWAHMVRVRPDAFHAVYCHTPARWLYGDGYLAAGGQLSLRQQLLKPALGTYRRVDRKAATRADLYIANSEATRRRIMKVYRRDAVVVSPPVDTGRFMPTPRGERLLVISRLLPYKRVDVIVSAATRLGIGLDVVGDGFMLPRLRALAGPGVVFHGAVDDATVVELMQSCRAVCIAAEEDFGIVALEAQAAGKPVIAYGRGGALENVEPGVSGVFFHDLSPEAVIDAISEADRLDAPPEAIAAGVERFSNGAFEERLRGALGDVYAGVH